MAQMERIVFFVSPEEKEWAKALEQEARKHIPISSGIGLYRYCLDTVARQIGYPDRPGEKKY